jgi:hypothetical protein
MADELKDAVFTEVLEVDVRSDKFKQGLDRLTKLYREWLSELGDDAKGVGEVSMFNDLSKQVKELSETTHTVLAEVQQGVNSLQSGMQSQIQQTDAALEKSSKKAKETSEERVRYDKEATEKIRRNMEELAADVQRTGKPITGAHPAQKKAQDIEGEQNVEVKRAVDALEKLERTKQDILNKETEAQEQAYKEELRQAKELEAQARERGKFIEQEAAKRRTTLTEEQEAQEQAYKEEIAREKDLAKQKQIRADFEEKTAKNRQAILNAEMHAAEQIAAREAGGKKFAEGISIEQQGLRQKANDDTVKGLQRELGLLNQIEEEKERIARIEEDLGGSDGANRRQFLDEKKLKLQKEYNKTLREAAVLKQQLDSIRPTAGADERLAATTRYKESISDANKLKGQLRGVRDEIHRIDEKNAGFTQRFSRDLKGHVAGLARMIVVIQAIIALEQALFFAISAPFLALKQGLDFLRQMEENTNSLALTLFANVKYSNDLKENFRVAKQIAGELAKDIQKIAALEGIDAGKLTDTFKALTEGGVTNLTKSAKEILDISTQFLILLQNMGSGALATQISMDEIAKLFKGELGEASSKFLQTLGISNKEWDRMIARARTQKDLVAQLQPRMAAYVEAVKQGEGSQQRLLNQIKLTANLVFGDAAGNLYEKLSKAISDFNQYLQTNQSDLSRWLKMFADGLLRVVEALGKMAAYTGILTVIAGVLRVVSIAALTVGDSFAAMADTIALSMSGLDEAWAQKSVAPLLKALEEIRKKGEENRKRYLSDLKFIATGENEPGKKEPSKTSTPFDPKNPPIDNRSRLPVVQAELALMKKRIEGDVTEIQEAYDEMRQSVARSLGAQMISQTDAVRELKSIADEEIAVLDGKRRALIANVLAQKALAEQEATNSVQREAVALRFEGEIEDVENRFAKLAVSIRKGIAGARVNAAEEMVSVLNELQRGRADSLAQEIEAAQAQIQEARQNGLLTEIQFFDAQAAVEDEAHKRRVTRLRDELAMTAVGSDERTKLLNDLALEEQRYTATVKLTADQRQRILEEEARRRTEHQQAMRAMMLEERILAGEINELINPPSGLSSAQQSAFDARQREIDQIEREKLALLELAAAKNAESEETRSLVEELQALSLQRSQLFAQRLSEINSGVGGTNARRTLIDSTVADQRRGFSNRLESASQSLRSFDQLNTGIELDPVLQAARDALAKAVDEAAKSLMEFNRAIEQDSPKLKTSLSRVLDVFIGAGTREAFEKARTNVDKFAIGAEGAVTALQNIAGLVDIFRQGAARGGIAGGIGDTIGAVSKSKAVTDLMSKIPIVGQFIPAIGGVLSLVGGMFTAAAKRIATDVKKSFQNTLEEYRSGNSTLVDTLGDLERQRQSAIIRLSGKKGGKDELKEILPDFDREIADLRKTQEKIFEDFDDALKTLNLQSDTLSQVNRQWQDINKQVKEYIGAGGDAAKAAEFLQLSLSKLQKQAADELAQSEQDAIQEALKLNDILKQRQKLVDDFAQKEFDLINADSVERRQAGSVTRGRELQQLRQQHQEDLDQMDQEIRLTTIRVDKQREIFNLATDVAALRRRDEELSLNALDTYIQKMKDLKSIVSGAFFGPNPTSVSSPTVQNFDITVYSNGGDGEQIGRDIVSEWQRQMRLSPA